jgi:hypothetical protein
MVYCTVQSWWRLWRFWRYDDLWRFMTTDDDYDDDYDVVIHQEELLQSSLSFYFAERFRIRSAISDCEIRSAI